MVKDRLRRFGVLLAVVAALALIPFIHRTAPSARADSSAERPYTISPRWPAGIRDFLRVETSPPVFDVLYHYGHTSAGPGGAYGPNVNAPRSAWYLEYQRYGDTDVIAGVLHRDPALVATGLEIFHYGLAREAANGSFPGSAGPFHGTAMFLAQAAPALLVLRYSAVDGRFASELSWETSRMVKAARYMVRAVGGPGHIDDGSKTQRFYEAALALEATGALGQDRRLERWSTLYARHAVGMERPGGVMPEDGGHDSGYQALGLVYATRYLALIAHGRLYETLYRAVGLAEQWEISRVRPDGTVDQAGDTRSGGCRERDVYGRCKTTFYAAIFSALARWSVVSGDERYDRVANLVWLQNWIRQPGDVLPSPGLWVRPATTHAGEWLTVWGTRFQPLEVVRVSFGSTLEATIQCDQTGSFGGHSPEPNAHFPLPPVAAGRYTVTARGSLGTLRRTQVRVVGS